MGSSDAYFVAVKGQDTTRGRLLVDGQSYPAVSGPRGNGYIPAGDYKITKEQDTVGKDNDTMLPPGQKGAKKWRLAAVGPKGASEKFWDERTKTWRSGLLVHFDGDIEGSLGCIAYQDAKAQKSMQNWFSQGNRNVHVEYFDTPEEAQKRIKELGGGDVSREELMKPEPPKEGQSASNTSVTKQNIMVAQGEPSVLLGQEQLQAAFKTAALTSGGQITQGSETVFLGKRQLPFARIEDTTTDSNVATGEQTVEIG